MALRPRIEHDSIVRMSDLFRPVPAGQDWRLNAVVGDALTENDATLARGFADLAKAGVQEVVSSGPNDALFVPILFAYRHAFELVLKEAIRQAAAVARRNRERRGQPVSRKLQPDKLDGKLAHMHQLGSLLDMLLNRLNEVEMETPSAETIDTIRQLDKPDSSGQTFRYTMVWTRRPAKSSSLDDLAQALWLVAGKRLGRPRPRPRKADEEEQRPARPDQLHVDVATVAGRLEVAFDLLYGGLLTQLDLELG